MTEKYHRGLGKRPRAGTITPRRARGARGNARGAPAGMRGSLKTGLRSAAVPGTLGPSLCHGRGSYGFLKCSVMPGPADGHHTSRDPLGKGSPLNLRPQTSGSGRPENKRPRGIRIPPAGKGTLGPCPTCRGDGLKRVTCKAYSVLPSRDGPQAGGEIGLIQCSRNLCSTRSMLLSKAVSTFGDFG